MPQTQGRHPDCSKPLCVVQLGIPDWACVLKRHQLHSLTCVLWLLIYCTQPTGHLLCREKGVRSGTEHLSQKDLKNHGKDLGITTGAWAPSTPAPSPSLCNDPGLHIKGTSGVPDLGFHSLSLHQYWPPLYHS